MLGLISPIIPLPAEAGQGQSARPGTIDETSSYAGILNQSPMIRPAIRWSCQSEPDSSSERGN